MERKESLKIYPLEKRSIGWKSHQKSFEWANESLKESSSLVETERLALAEEALKVAEEQNLALKGYLFSMKELANIMYFMKWENPDAAADALIEVSLIRKKVFESENHGMVMIDMGNATMAHAFREFFQGYIETELLAMKEHDSANVWPDGYIYPHDLKERQETVFIKAVWI